jgi:hypothetical protein
VAGIGFLVAFFGYSVLYFGLDQLQGGNNGFLSLIVPGKFTEQAGDFAPTPPGTITAVTGGSPFAGGAVATGGNPGGLSAWSATTPPNGAPPGQYRVNQDGDIEVLKNGQWVLYSTPNGQKPSNL